MKSDLDETWWNFTAPISLASLHTSGYGGQTGPIFIELPILWALPGVPKALGKATHQEITGKHVYDGKESPKRDRRSYTAP